MFLYASIPFLSIYNQSIPIYLSIGIDNQYQSITTSLRHRLVIDYQYQLINSYWLVSIDIDCHWLSIPSIGYPGENLNTLYFFVCLILHDKISTDSRLGQGTSLSHTSWQFERISKRVDYRLKSLFLLHPSEYINFEQQPRESERPQKLKHCKITLFKLQHAAPYLWRSDRK